MMTAQKRLALRTHNNKTNGLAPSHSRGFAPILILLVVVLLIGGAYYFGTMKKSSVQIVSTSPSPVATASSSPVDETTNWKTYSSKKIEGMSFSAFSIKYPSKWNYIYAPLDKNDFDGPFSLSLVNGSTQIVISQFPVGGGVCLFNGDKPFDGPGGETIYDSYVEVNTNAGLMRRTYNTSQKTWEFCQSSPEYFKSPTSVGDITYIKATDGLLKEMDQIISTIKFAQ